jgi:hypothetical protein
MSHRWLMEESGKERLQKNGRSAGLDIGALCAIALSYQEHTSWTSAMSGAVHVRNAHVRIVERRRVLGEEPEFQPLKVRPT